MDDQEKVWDDIAPEWSKFRTKTMQEVKDFLKNKKGYVLDLGCGSGRNFVKSENFKIYGVDFSKKMLEHAEGFVKKQDIDVVLIKAHAFDLPFEDNSFNSAIYVAALHCIETSEKRKKSLEELFRVLKPNSEALITVWSKKHVKLVKHPKESTVSWKKNSEKIYRYYYFYEKDELKKILENVGFKIISIIDDKKNIIVIVKKPNHSL